MSAKAPPARLQRSESVSRVSLKLPAACLLIAAAGWAQQPPADPLAGRDIKTVRIGGDIAAPVAVPRGYAVVIGISKYKNLSDDQQLQFAERDAESIYQVLISREAGNIEFGNIKKLFGADATRENIRQAIEEWLPSRATAADRVIVYFVGHGLVDANRAGYLAPYDVDIARVAGTAYPMSALSEALSRNKARWKVLLTDACHSGKVTPESTFESVNDAFRQLPRGFLTLNSSRESERSFEDPKLGHGVFSYFLAQAWMGQADDDPADGIVTADEMVNYVRREVSRYVRAQKERQTPTDHGDFPNDLLLGYAPSRREKLAVNTELTNGTLVVEANLEGVEVFVDNQRYGVASPGKPVQIPGLASGDHAVRGAHPAFESVRQTITLGPGATQTVTLRMQYRKTVKPGAKAKYDDAASIWDRSKGSPKDLAKARGLLDEALRDDARYAAAHLLRCRVQAALNDSPGAVKSCRAAVNLDETSAEARVMLGVVLLQSGDAAEAVRELQKAVEITPGDAYSQSVLSEALVQVDRYPEAEKAAGASIARNAASAQAFLMRGEARLLQDKHAEAAADYQEALRLSDFGSGALRTVAFFAIGHGITKHRSGRQVLHRSQKAAAYFGLCSCEFAMKNFIRAIGYCERALKEDKSDADTYVLMGQNYLELFNRDNRRDYLGSAQESLESALRLAPWHERQRELKSQLGQIRELLPRVR
ncbi:MAG: caspase family protein [Bryobacteraceae bacterium]